MPDRDEVVRCLEPIIGCAKQEKWGAWIDTLEDAVALLKPVPAQTLFITPYRTSGMKHGRCPGCDALINSVSNKVACGRCGMVVSWDG